MEQIADKGAEATAQKNEIIHYCKLKAKYQLRMMTTL
jgi:hypothetical protein